LKTLRKLDDLKPDPVNPREIDEKSQEGLGRSMDMFGDISGITWNGRTGLLVTGHQRVKELRSRYGDKLKLETLTLKRGRGKASTKRVLTTPDGGMFEVRVVDWEENTAHLAMVTANNQAIAGDWTIDLAAVLKSAKAAANTEDLQILGTGNLDDILKELRIKAGELELGETPVAAHRSISAMVTCPKCGTEFKP